MSDRFPSIAEARALLERAMTVDRFRLSGRVREMARNNDPNPDHIQHVMALLARSAERRAAREQNLPRPVFDSPGIVDLPVVRIRDQIAAAIRDHQVVVVCGATGSGKTTQLPKICLAPPLGRGTAGLIGHTQPRRIAARSVAARIAQELGTNLGNAVGYKVRFTDRSSRTGYVKLMTDGILLAETQGDPLLAHYDTLIIDEAHERSLNIDFLLGYIRQLLPKRPDLKVIVTSATIDPQSFSEHFADASGRPAPVIEVSGRTYPVEVRYRPLQRPTTGSRGGDEDVLELEMEEAVVEAARELIGGGGRLAAESAEPGGNAEPVQTESPGSPATAPPSRQSVSSARDRDMLVFLPGEREIRETADELKKSGGVIKQCEIIPLYSRLSTDEQNRVFERHDQQRIILATNVAETSLTVPGIKYVIDSGLARISRYSPRIKVQRLPIEPISRASAQQRAGRCGRTSPGVCIRLYAEDEFESRPEFTEPEILRTNLASVILQMKALRLVGPGGDISSFPFMQPPDGRAVRDGYDTLLELGAFDAVTGDLTSVGWKLAKLPVDPRIGRMILAAVDERSLWEVIIIAAALSIQDPRQRPADKAEQADAIHEKYRDPESDFLSFLKLWREFRKKDHDLSGGQLRKWCASQMLSYVRLREWQDVQRQLTELVEELGFKVEQRHAGYDQIHRALLAGLLSNIGHRGGGGGGGAGGGGGNPFEYDGVRGLKFAIFPGSALFKEKPKWVMAAELVRTTRLYARTVANIQPAWVEKLAPGLVGREYEEPHWMGETAQVGAYETVTLWGLPIIRRRRVHYGPVDPQQSRAIFIEHALVKGEYLTPGRFFEHNFKQQKQIERLEERKRHHDLLADPGTRFEFYAQRLPADVFDGPGFERWRKKAESRQPDLLIMQKQDLLAAGAVEPPPEQYPDAIDVPLLDEHGKRSGSARISLEYRHKHLDPQDGITATIPATLLASLDDTRFAWLVPGFAREKIVELIKLLPKATRVNLAPAARFADEAVRTMPFGEGDFLAALAATLARLSGVSIAADAWDGLLGQLPEHLRMNFRIIEESAGGVGGGLRVVGQGRDLGRIRRELADRAAAALAGIPQGPFNRGGIVVWDDELGTLPSAIDVSSKGLVMRAYVAVRDETSFGDAGRGRAAVGVRLFADPAMARAAHLRGVNRLLAMQVTAEATSLIQHTPGVERILLNASTLGAPDALRKDLSELVGLRAFSELDGLGAIRSPAAFEAGLNSGWNRLGRAATEVIALAGQVFDTHQRIQLALQSAPAHWAPTLSDIHNQLALLLGPAAGRFLIDTPFEWLRHYPRYLAGILLRLEKCGGASRVEIAGEGLQRDWRQMNEFRPLWADLLDRLRLVGGIPGARDTIVQFRWLLEELRVSLFAQELRTSQSVSVKKLTQRWSELVGEGGGR